MVLEGIERQMLVSEPDAIFFCVFPRETYLKFGFKFRKTRPNRQVTEKKKYIYICTKKRRNNNIFFTLYTIGSI